MISILKGPCYCSNMYYYEHSISLYFFSFASKNSCLLFCLLVVRGEKRVQGVFSCLVLFDLLLKPHFLLKKTPVFLR